MIVTTEFDNPLEEDVVLEETEQTMQFSELMKNTENILKAYLYIKKIVDASNPFVNKVIKADTINTTDGKSQYLLNENTGKILIKNISPTDSYSIFFNGGEFVLFPFEKVELPVDSETIIETFGMFSIIESEYKLGKGN